MRPVIAIEQIGEEVFDIVESFLGLFPAPLEASRLDSLVDQDAANHYAGSDRDGGGYWAACCAVRYVPSAIDPVEGPVRHVAVGIEPLGPAGLADERIGCQEPTD